MSEPATLFVAGPRDGGKRLDQFLHERIPGLSRTRIQRAIRERVTLSWGVEARPATPVRPGGQVEIGYAPLAETPLAIELPILARGAGWLAVDKPPGIPVHPVNRVRENSLIRILRRQEGRDGLRLVHRLDSETSGVLLVAEDPPTSRSLCQAFKHGQVHKEYLAWVAGSVAEEAGCVDLPIGDARESRVYLKLEAGHGKAALTEWRVERRLEDKTLLRLFPATGRRHQLRVHLAALGHPILGDMLYGHGDRQYLNMVRGVGDIRQTGDGPTRQLLHCELLRFPDPAGQGAREVRAPLPLEFELEPR
jgi:23S rRNA pseudouridine1911/1915/1917 synthase